MLGPNAAVLLSCILPSQTQQEYIQAVWSEAAHLRPKDSASFLSLFFSSRGNFS